MAFLQVYPGHLQYLFLYGIAVLLAFATIARRIGQHKTRWGALLMFFVLLGFVGGMFAVGFNALSGFQHAQSLGIGVLGVFLLTGLIFAWNVNSRNIALLPLIFMLSSSGLVMLYRLSLLSRKAFTTEFQKQIIFTVVGVCLMFAVIRMLKLIFLLDVHGDRIEMLGLSQADLLLGKALHLFIALQRKLSYHLWLGVTLVLLAIPLVLGSEMRLSLGSIQVQPSEFVKITFVVYLTYHLTQYRQKIGAWDEPILRRIGFLLPPLATLSLPFFGYILQRDFGPLMLYSLLILCMFFVGTSRLLEVGVILLVFLATIIGYNQFYPYVNALVPKYAAIIIDRINIWQNPWLYTRGEQIVRSLWAIKAGGLWGTGFGQGHPEFFPSEVQNDFIFTLITHEMGLLGGMLVILTYVLFCLQGIRIALATKYDDTWNADWAWFRLRLALGCTLILFFQALINIGGVINFSLLTGITLPYISYGGTSLLVSYIIAGILAFCSLTKNELR